MIWKNTFIHKIAQITRIKLMQKQDGSFEACLPDECSDMTKLKFNLRQSVKSVDKQGLLE